MSPPSLRSATRSLLSSNQTHCVGRPLCKWRSPHRLVRSRIMIAQITRTVVTEINVNIIATILSSGAIAVIAWKEGIAWWNERPSIEAFLRPTTGNKIAVMIVNNGRRAAKKVQYAFIPQDKEETYKNFGCFLDFNKPSAPFTLIKEYPVEIQVTHLSLASQGDSIMPPFQVQIIRKGKLYKDKVVDLDVRTFWNISWSSSRNTLRSIEDKLGVISKKLGEIRNVLNNTR